MLVTERLVLRPLQENDLDGLAALLGDPVAMRYVGDGRPVEKEEAARRLLKARESFAGDGTGALGIVLAATGQLIGYCGLEPGEDTGELELNYAISPAYWGRGIGLEAAAAVLAYADGFREVIHASADPRNEASLLILRRLGFERTHTANDVHGLPTVFFRRARPLRSPNGC